MKDELGGKIIMEFATLRPKTYSYLTDHCKEDKKAKGTKKCVIKRMIKFNDYKNCLLKDEVILKSQQRFISKKHDVYTESINKIELIIMMIKEQYPQTKLQIIHMDIKVKMRWFKKYNQRKIPRDWWKYLDQIILKGLVGVIR